MGHSEIRTRNLKVMSQMLSPLDHLHMSELKQSGPYKVYM